MPKASSRRNHDQQHHPDPEGRVTGVYGAIVKRMSRKMLGDVPEPVEVTWHNRKVLNFTFASVARRRSGTSATRT